MLNIRNGFDFYSRNVLLSCSSIFINKFIFREKTTMLEVGVGFFWRGGGLHVFSLGTN